LRFDTPQLAAGSFIRKDARRTLQRMCVADRYEENGFVEGQLLGNKTMTRFISSPAYQMKTV
jgi:hypothetical protein